MTSANMNADGFPTLEILETHKSFHSPVDQITVNLYTNKMGNITLDMVDHDQDGGPAVIFARSMNVAGNMAIMELKYQRIVDGYQQDPQADV